MEAAIALLIGFGSLCVVLGYWAQTFYSEYRYSLLLQDLPHKMNDLRLGHITHVPLWPLVSGCDVGVRPLMMYRLTGRVRSLWTQSGDQRAIVVDGDGLVKIECEGCHPVSSNK